MALPVAPGAPDPFRVRGLGPSRVAVYAGRRHTLAFAASALCAQDHGKEGHRDIARSASSRAEREDGWLPIQLPGGAHQQ